MDTNIFIQLEDSSVELKEGVGELNRLASGEHQLLIHPETMADLARDKNTERKEKIIARLDKYKKLESPPNFSDKEEEFRLMGRSARDNDHVDNLILLALHKNCAHWLVTEDLGIHKKAKRIDEGGINIAERVLTVEQAIDILRKPDPKESYLYANIQNVPCHNIDAGDPFFDSLRSDYDTFDDWYTKCQKEGRRAWLCREKDEIHAMCIFKPEADPVVASEKPKLEGEVLKLCTFKVAKLGLKMGELLLKRAFNYAIDHALDYIYVTVEPEKHKSLVSFFEDFGFCDYGLDTKGGDRVLVKQFPKSAPHTKEPPLEYATKYYPFIKIESNTTYLVPIKPEYHKILFPELEQPLQLSLHIFPPLPASNAIKQAYLCHSPTKSIQTGDILFFYRTRDASSITTYGVVEKFYIETDLDKIYQWVAKRTVYTFEDIKSMADGREVRIILFRLVAHIKERVDYNKLTVLGIVKGSIQSIRKLTKEKVDILLKEAKINDRVLSN